MAEYSGRKTSDDSAILTQDETAYVCYAVRGESYGWDLTYICYIHIG